MSLFAGIMAGAGMGLSIFTAYQQNKSQQAMAEYNAKLAENQALQNKYAIAAEQDKLARGQRNIKAQQRMSVASRGGLMAGTDLETLMNEAKKMQLDQLELQRKQDLAIIQGTAEAAMYRYQKDQLKSASKWIVPTAVMQGIGTYSSLGGKIPSFGKGGSTPTMAMNTTNMPNISSGNYMGLA